MALVIEPRNPAFFVCFFLNEKFLLGMEASKNFGFCSHVKEGLWLKSRVMSLIHDIFRTYISPFPQQFLDLRWDMSPNTIVTAVLKFHWLQETSWLSFVVVVLQSHKRGKGREKELVEFSCQSTGSLLLRSLIILSLSIVVLKTERFSSLVFLCLF